MTKTLAQKIQSISPTFVMSGAMAGFNTDQMLSLVSKLLEPQKIAVLQLHYPEVDAKNHKSLHAVVATLNSHGMSEAAEIVSQEVPYILADDLKKVLQVYREIQNDSAAVGVTLRFAGLTGAAAEAQIQAEIQNAKPQVHGTEMHLSDSALAHAA